MNLETLAEREVFATFLALALLLAGAYLCGRLMERIHAPKVIGEILGGMLFGGTFLHHFFPDAMESIFMAYPGEGKVLNLFYQLGLVFLMFSSGFNTKLALGRHNRALVWRVFAGATILPILGALPFVGLFQPYFIGERGNNISFLLVFVIGVAITSIPVISKIFFDMGVMNTAFANTVLTVSTIQDLALWIMLNAATLIATTGTVEFGPLLVVVIATAGLFALVQWLAIRLEGKVSGKRRDTDFYTTSVILLLVLCALLQRVGINMMYTAFLVGYMIRALSRDDSHAAQRMQVVADFSFSVFVPVYFALVGIQLNLLHHFSPVRFLVFFLVAFGLEAAGTILTLWFTKLRRKTVLNFAVTMNARGGPGIVLATVAYSAQIINIEFFTALILLTMLSSFLAGYWLRYQQGRAPDIFETLYE